MKCIPTFRQVISPLMSYLIALYFSSFYSMGALSAVVLNPKHVEVVCMAP